METTGHIHTLEDHNSAPLSTVKVVMIFVVVVIAGIAIGYGSAHLTTKPAQQTQVTGQTVSTDKMAGIVDKKTFKDQAEGVLRNGGIDGEGTFHLERPGGVSQNVYLTSSTVDLSPYVGQKVRVYGQTYSGQKAGWLMDVGLIERI